MADTNAPLHYVRLKKEQAPAEDINPGELNQPIQVPQATLLSYGSILSASVTSFCASTCCLLHLFIDSFSSWEFIDVLNVGKSYQPPADEDWTTGIYGCFEDLESCRAGLFCPCVLFGHNVEALKEEIPWPNACACHALFVEGGMLVATVTSFLHGLDPNTSFLICESLLFTWWICGIYTGIFRQELQRKYHLKDSPCDPCVVHCCLHWCALCQEHREMRNHLSESSDTQMTVINPPPVQQMRSSDEQRQSSASLSTSTLPPPPPPGNAGAE